MLKFPKILALSFLWCGLIFPTALAIFPNWRRRNDLLNSLREQAIVFQFRLCYICYETVGDLTAPASSISVSGNLGLSEDEIYTIAAGMQDQLVGAARTKYDTMQIGEEFRLPECTEVTKRSLLYTLLNNPEVMSNESQRNREAVMEKFVKEYQKDAKDRYNCKDVFKMRDRGETI